VSIAAPLIKIECKDEKNWLKERERLAVTASDAYMLLTKPLQLYARKKGLIDGPVQSERMSWGKRLQGEIAKGFGEDTGREVALADPYTIFVHPDYPFVGATPDAFQMRVADKESDGALEIKNTDREWSEDVPVYYQTQLQVQLACLQYRWGTVAGLYRGNKLIWSDIMRHDAFIRRFLSKAEEFQWRLTNNKPPEVDSDGSEEAGKAIAALFPKDSGATVELPGEAVDWTAEIHRLEAQQAEVEEAIRLRKNLLKRAIGEATYGVMIDGRQWSYKAQERVMPPQPARTDKFRVLRLMGGKN
jgi:predicted phage-related endonuclease